MEANVCKLTNKTCNSGLCRECGIYQAHHGIGNDESLTPSTVLVETRKVLAKPEHKKAKRAALHRIGQNDCFGNASYASRICKNCEIKKQCRKFARLNATELRFEPHQRRAKYKSFSGSNCFGRQAYYALACKGCEARAKCRRYKTAC